MLAPIQSGVSADYDVAVALRRSWDVPLLPTARRCWRMAALPALPCEASEEGRTTAAAICRALWIVRFLLDVSFLTLCFVQCHPNVTIASHAFLPSIFLHLPSMYLRGGIWLAGHFAPSRHASAQKDLRTSIVALSYTPRTPATSQDDLLDALEDMMEVEQREKEGREADHDARTLSDHGRVRAPRRLVLGKGLDKRLRSKAWYLFGGF